MTFIIGADGRDGFFRQLERGLFVSDEELRRRREQEERDHKAGNGTFTVDTSTPNHIANPPGQHFPPAEQPKFKSLPAHRRIHGQRKGKERRW